MKAFVARDMDGKLFLFTSKPVKDYDMWLCVDGCAQLPGNTFPNVSWKDEESVEVEVTISMKGGQA